MTFLEDVLTPQIVQRLGWTLLHFIWQATAVALLAAALLAVMRKSTSSVRYTVACMALGLIVLLPVVTIQLVPVSVYEPPVTPPSSAPVITPMEQVSELPPVEAPAIEPPAPVEKTVSAPVTPWWQRASERLEPALPHVVSAWLIGVLALSVWHLGGWTQLQRLRRRMVKPVDASLVARLNDLAERLGITRAVQLTESALVQIPTVVGWLRPVILLPASALTGLSPGQLEAILAHELAHIRRHDYLVNMLQTIVETLGFYHPAVWWISHKIRAERENCCDDLAVSLSGDRLGYARALASMEEIRSARSELAVAATGGNLLGRIRRLLGKDSAAGSQAGWMPSLITVLLITTIAIPTTLVLNADSQSQQSELGINAQVEDEESGSAAITGTKRPTAENIRTVHFPEDRAVGTLKVRMARRDEESDRGLLSLPGWILLDREAQGDVNVDAGVELKLEVSRDVTDMSFLSDLEPNDLQVLMLSNMNISDEQLVHLKGLTGLLGLDLGSTTIEGDGLVHLAPLESLRRLSLFNTQVSDAGLAHLSALRSLKYLNLCMTQVRGPGLEHLKNLTSLVSLDLAATPATDESLAHLAELTWLRELPIYDTDITDKGLAHLKPLRSLEALILGKSGRRHDYSPISDEGLVHLKELHSLRDLHLLQTRVTDAGLAHLSTLTKLEALDLRETQITGEGLVFLKGLPALTYLNLKQTGVGRTGLAHLKEMTKLRRLELGEVSMGQADLKELEDALPNCRVKAESAGSSAGTVSITRAIAENPASAGEHEALVLIDCRVLEINPSMTIDSETLIAAENLLGQFVPTLDDGDKAAPRRRWPSGREISKSWKPTVEEFFAEVVGTVRVDTPEGLSSVANSARTTQRMIDLLASKGYMKILMAPTLKVVDGQTARIASAGGLLGELQIRPKIADSRIVRLLAEGTITREFPQLDPNQPPSVESTSFSTEVGLLPGWSLIVRGKRQADGSTNAERPPSQVVFILTPTIVKTDGRAENEAEAKPPQKEEPSARTVPVLTRSPEQPVEGATPIEVRCFVLEIPHHPEHDKDIAEQARAILKDKMSAPSAGTGHVTYAARLLKGIIEASRPAQDINSENYVTLDELDALIQALAAKGYVKILMKPTIQVADRQTATLSTGPNLFRVAAQLLDDDYVDLQAHVALASELPPQDGEQKPMVGRRSISSEIRLKAGTAATLGGAAISKNAPDSENVTGATELLCIVTATQADSAEEPQDERDAQAKLTSDRHHETVQLRVFKLKYADAERIRENIEALYQPQTDGVKAISYPEARQVTVIASPTDLLWIADKIAQWDVPPDMGQLKPRIITLRYSDPVQMVRFLTALFAEEDAEGTTIYEVISGKDAERERRALGLLSEQFKFELVPGTKKIIVTSNIPNAYDGVQKLILELDNQRVTADDVAQVHEWFGRLARHARPGASSESAKEDYTADDGLAFTATVEDPPRKMATRVYDISDLIGEPANRGGTSREMQVHNLVQLIQKRVEPESWHDSDKKGQGTIAFFPRQAPKKLAVGNTSEVHRQVEGLLASMRSGMRSGVEKPKEPSVNKAQIMIETQILEATDDFLKDNRLDANSVPQVHFRPADLRAPTDSAAEPNSPPYILIFDDHDVDLLLKAKVDAPKGKGAKVVAAPRVCAFDGEPVTMKTVTEHAIPGPSDPNDPSGKGESELQYVEVGRTIKITAAASPDTNNVLLDFEWEYSQVVDFAQRIGRDGKKQKVPVVDRSVMRVHAIVPEGKTILIGGRKIRRQVVTGSKVPLLGDIPLVGGLFRNTSRVEDTQNVLILVKPTVNPQ